MKGLRPLNIFTILGSGEGTPAEPAVHEVAYGLIIFWVGLKVLESRGSH